MSVSIQGLDKAKVLAALYNGARAQGAGFFHYDPTPMSEEEAQKILDGHAPYFDYLKGRVMKIDLSGDEVEEWLYDRDNGQGAFAQIIESLRKTGDTNSEEAELRHLEGTRNAAIVADEHIYDRSVAKDKGRNAGMELGLGDLAPYLKPKIDAVLGKKEDTDEGE